MPLGMTKEVDLPSDHMEPAKLTNWYAKLIRVGIPTKVDTSTWEVDMIGRKHIMSGSDKSTWKVDLMKASKSQGINNNLNKDKSTCLKNQDKRIKQSVVANWNERVEAPNGYGVNMNLIAKAIEVIMNLKLKVMGYLMRICLQLRGMVEKSLIKMKEDQVTNICKITIKVEDFDEAMLVVQVQVGKFEVKDVLLDSGSDVNIISKNLRKNSDWEDLN